MKKNQILGYILVEMDDEDINDSSGIVALEKDLPIEQFAGVAPDFYICEVRAIKIATEPVVKTIIRELS